MLDHLKSKLKASANFPSPPAIAQQIIALAGDPHTDISQVAAVIGRDPALAAKLLRVANSALYSRQRKSTNLRQALIALGLHGATTGHCLRRNVLTQGKQVLGLALIASEPREFTIVNIVGAIDLDKLHKLEGQFRPCGRSPSCALLSDLLKF